MIKTLSPHYKTIPWMSPSSGTLPDKYIMNIYIWEGLKASVPGVTTYEQENINPLGRTGDSHVNISRFINDFLTTSLITNSTTSLNDANSLVWIKTEIIYYIGGVAQSPEFIEIESALKGYGYGMEGENPTIPINNYLATTAEQKVSPNSTYLFSFLASETVDTVIKLNTLELTKTATTDSTELVQSVYVKVSEFDTDYIEIYKDDILITTLLVTDEPRYTPIDIAFLNKEGQLQTITFFKKKIDKIKTDSEEFESSIGQPLDGIHQFRTYNVNGQETFKINSGFVIEDNNEIFKQLLLSTKIWQIENNIYIPLNIKTSSLEYQSRQKDRLLNYSIEFAYSFNEINNI